MNDIQLPPQIVQTISSSLEQEKQSRPQTQGRLYWPFVWIFIVACIAGIMTLQMKIQHIAAFHWKMLIPYFILIPSVFILWSMKEWVNSKIFNKNVIYLSLIGAFLSIGVQFFLIDHHAHETSYLACGVLLSFMMFSVGFLIIFMLHRWRIVIPLHTSVLISTLCLAVGASSVWGYCPKNDWWHMLVGHMGVGLIVWLLLSGLVYLTGYKTNLSSGH